MNKVNYKIECKSDFANGAYLITKIAQEKVDKNALYAISADPPRFILPFTYKNIDGEMEIVYKIGNLCKLAYFQGELSADEYAELWTSLLEPLLDCGDWFLTPGSFVLSMDYLYYDKKRKSAVYVYVPSIESDSGKNSFSEMAAAVSNIMTASDTVLENKMLRSILENLSPRELLEVLKEQASQKNTSSAGTFEADASHRGGSTRSPTNADHALNPAGDRLARPVPQLSPSADGLALFDNVPEVPADKNVKQARKESGRFKMFGTKSKKKKEPKSPVKPQTGQQFDDGFSLYEQHLQGIAENLAPVPQAQTTITDITESIPVLLQKVSLKCTGKAELPQLIDVELSEGDIFSIGRHDAVAGRPQSSFEFDKKTKAVSRRHAVIERDDEGYKIIDLASRAGTFVDGQKLPPNTPHQLNIGTRVSFGNFGADYVWDASYHAP